MNAFLTFLFGILEVVNSGAHRIIGVSGVPVDVAALGDDCWVVSCVDPPGVYLVYRDDWSLVEYTESFLEPQGIVVVSGIPVICDRRADILLVGLPGETREIPMPGGPFAAVETDWNGDGTPSLAVALRDAGMVVLVDETEVRPLVELPGARGLCAVDVDLDGREDLLVACCGTGLHLVGNTGGHPAPSRIGILNHGIKSVVPVDMDEDGFPDAVGIACSEGGVRWWRNPGLTGGEWERFDIDPGMEGPKGLTVGSGGILVAALFSPSGLYRRGEHLPLPRGCVSCAFDENGGFALGHRLGFLLEFKADPAPEGSSPPSRLR
jgi:hypothetical protein